MPVTTIRENGASENRVDIIFTGDGYTSSEINTVYQDHINNLVAYMFSDTAVAEPFFLYQNFFNIHYVSVISDESGADDPNNDIAVDTALDASFNFDGVTDRLLYVNSSKAHAVLNDALAGTAIAAEMKFIPVNTDKYGGGGGSFGVYAGGNSFSLDTALHEIGHSFAYLADEYTYGGPDTYEGPDPGAPNSTTDPTGAKWSHWLGYEDPNLGVVGVYEGSSYSNFGAYRPTISSKMRSSSAAFDPIAKEAFILRFYEFVDPLDDWTGKGGLMAMSNPLSLNVQAIDDGVIDIEWRVDGEVVGGDQNTLDISSLSLSHGMYQISARAYDNTGLVRKDLDKVEQNVNWTVEIGNSPVITGLTFGTVEEDGAQTASGTLAVNDIDAGDDPSFTAQIDTEGAYGLFSIGSEGVWSYSLDNASVQFLAEGATTTDSFNATATTDDGESVEETVTITISGAEDAPVIAGTNTGAVEEDGAQTVSGTLAVSDLDDPDNPSFVTQSFSNGTYGYFSIGSEGSWSYSLDNASVQFLAEGATVSDRFTATAETEDGEEVTQTVTIVINGTEDTDVGFTFTSYFTVPTLTWGIASEATVYAKNFDTTSEDSDLSDVTVYAYLSSDDALDGADVRVGSHTFASIAAGEYQQASIALTAPEDLAEGDYRLIYSIDPLDAIEERDETNNLLVVEDAVTVEAPRADLGFTFTTSFVAPALTQGAASSTNVYVQNYNGTADASDVTVYAYLSSDDALDGADVRVGSHTFASIAAGEYQQASIALTAPEDLAEGDYRLIYSIDPLDAIEERDETNNLLVVEDAVTVEAFRNTAATGAVSITGDAVEGTILGVDTSAVVDPDGVGTFRFVWLRNSTPILGASSAEYLVAEADFASQLSVEIAFTDSAGGDEHLTSSLTTAVVVGDDVVRSTSFSLQSDGPTSRSLTLTGTSDIIGTGNDLANLLIGNNGDNVLSGMAGDDTIRGGLGEDRLYGGPGADRMVGGQNGDFYIVDNVGDVVVEVAGDVGIDRVASAVSFDISDIDIETLILGGSANTNGTGNDKNNYILGSLGNNEIDGGGGNDRIEAAGGDDTLRGGAGNDTMNGGPGSDIFYVEDAGDRVAESRRWEGEDHVIASVDFRMGSAHIETLELVSDARLGAGNGLRNTITGNDADNLLDGGKNVDTLIGGAGDDIYLLRAPGDNAVEEVGGGIDTVRAFRTIELDANVENLHIQTLRNAAGEGVPGVNGFGNALDNEIIGNPFDNVIAGRGGNDTLRGQAGADTFLFDTALGADNADVVLDFNVGAGNTGDRLQMDQSVFTGLVKGELAPGLFATGTAAADANDRFVFDSATGRLFFDADGAGGASQQLIATFANGAVVEASDIVLV